MLDNHIYVYHPNLNSSNGNAKTFTANIDPFCQQGKVVVEEVVETNLGLKQRLV